MVGITINMKQVSVDNAAQIIGVSSATIRNWAKAGHINPVCTCPLSFLEDSILHLKSKIGTDSFGKLKTRANKVGSVSNILPSEYAENPNLIAHIENVVAQFKANGLKSEYLLFLAALRLLETECELKRCKTTDVFDLSSYDSWARKSVRAVIAEWRDSLKEIDGKDSYINIYNSLMPHEGDDFLGLLYQSISSEGNKSEQGAYYTPSKIVEDAIDNMIGSIETFLDPCCGTGKYLILAARKFGLHPQNIYGFDCNEVAVKIARINLLLEFKKEEFTPNVYCLDSLSELANGEMFCETNELIGKIDAIATNPPWGAYKNSLIPKQFKGKIKSGETYSMFLIKSIELLRRDGQLSFILPESILKIRTHSDIREIILNQVRISKIAKLGRQFTGVFTPVIRLDGSKGLQADDWFVSVEENGNFHSIEQNRFKNNDNFTFDVETATHEEGLLNKIYSVKHETLFKNAEWALGIVTGNNKKYVLEVKSHGAEAVIRGSAVYQFNIGEPSSFILFTPKDFQQVAPERFFRATEKLIYKFISKKLVFAYDNKKRLTLNSANILIPAIPGMSIKVALAFLNSCIFQYIFKKRFSTHKVLRGDLEKLPFPIIDKSTHDIIEQLVDSVLSGCIIPAELESLLFSIFNLTDEEILIIKHEVKE